MGKICHIYKQIHFEYINSKPFEQDLYAVVKISKVKKDGGRHRFKFEQLCLHGSHIKQIFLKNPEMKSAINFTKPNEIPSYESYVDKVKTPVEIVRRDLNLHEIDYVLDVLRGI